MESVQPGIGATWSFRFRGRRVVPRIRTGRRLNHCPDGRCRRVNMEEIQTITDEGIIKDHALRMCPDGRFYMPQAQVSKTTCGVYARR